MFNWTSLCCLFWKTTENKNLEFLPWLDYSLAHKQIKNKLFSINTLSIIYIFVGFAKLRKATVSFVMSVRPSVCRHVTTLLPLDGFLWNFKFWYFRKSVEKIPVSFKSDKNKEYILRRPMYIFLSHLSQFFLEWEIFQTKVVEKIKYILRSITFVENRRAGQATDDNMAHGRYILDTQGYKYTISICNAYWFSTVTMVARTRLHFMLYAPSMSCLVLCISVYLLSNYLLFPYIYTASCCNYNPKSLSDWQSRCCQGMV